MAVIFLPAFGVPLLLALLIATLSLVGGDPARAVREGIARFSWLAVVPAGIALALDDGDRHAVDWLLLGTSIRLDDLARTMGLLAVIVYGLALSFVVRSKSERPHVLVAFLLLCFAGNLGVFLADDLVTFYLSFAAMSFLAYAIVVHDRTRAARRAGAIYLVMTVIGETAVLAALMLISAAGAETIGDAPAAVAASPARDLIVTLLLIGFGVKAGTVPLHVWLPLAHPAAPSPASAVLSGVMLKAGIVGWLRFLPLGEDAFVGWGTAFVLLGLIGGSLALPVGLLQDNPKVILAYSSIGQMGFLTALVGAGLIDPALAPACIVAAVLYAFSHGLVKGALFLGVQSWDVERLPRAVTATALVVAGLGIVGAPLTSGFLAKYAGKEAVAGIVVPGTLGVPLADILPWFGVASTLLLARFAVVMARRERHPRPTARTRDAAWVLLSVGAIVPTAIVADAAVRRGLPLSLPGLFDPSAVWSQSWPLLLGLALAVAAWALARRPGLARSRVAHPRGDLVPAGDIVVVEERAVRALGRAFGRVDAGLGRARTAVAAWAAGRPSPLRAAEAVQRRLDPWPASGLVIAVALAVALAVVATWGVLS